MIKPPSQKELQSYFAQLESMGESSVRVAVYSGSWENDRLRLGAAAEWLRLKDEERQRRRSISNWIAAISALIAAITAIIVAKTTIADFILSLLKKGP